MTEVVWRPSQSRLANTQLTRVIEQLSLQNYDELYELSICEPARFWAATLDLLGVQWETPYTDFVSFERGLEQPQWFVGGRLNAARLAVRRGEEPGTGLQTALICEDEAGVVRSLSYGDLNVAVAALAAGLRVRGVKEGDRVGLLLPMNADAVVAFLAVASLGAIAVPLFSGFGADAGASRLALAGATCLVSTESFIRRGRVVDLIETIGRLRGAVASLSSIIIRRTTGKPLPSWAEDWEELVDERRTVTPVAVGSDAPLMVLFTSGTTGRPKGLIHTHGGFPLKVMQDCAQVFDIHPGDIIYWPTDLGWVLGPITILGVLGLGATLVLFDGALDVPTWERFGRVASRHGVTHLGASPTLIRTLASKLPECPRKFPRLRTLMAAGEVLDPEHFLWFHHAFGKGHLPLVNYSGGTEVSGGLVANVLHRPITPSRFNSAVPGVQLAAFNDAGTAVFAQPGELVVLKPCVGMAQGFWTDSERFFETYWQRFPGVWAHGDLIEADRDGTIRILGRADDTLKIAGKRTGPAEIESVALEHEDIAEVAAIGIPDGIRGEALVVLAIAVPGSSLPPAALELELREAIGQRLGRPFTPHRVHLVADLPRTRTGKIMRRLARNAYTQTPELGDTSALENPDSLELLRSCGFAASAQRSVQP